MDTGGKQRRHNCTAWSIYAGLVTLMPNKYAEDVDVPRELGQLPRARWATYFGSAFKMMGEHSEISKEIYFGDVRYRNGEAGAVTPANLGKDSSRVYRCLSSSVP